MRANLEIKARCPDRAAARAGALALGAAPAGLERQRDTFFHSASGRLKLREIEGERAWLIGYHRSDRSEARRSRYTLVEIGDPAGLREALAATLGIRGEVVKVREILLWRNVRIHLDEVVGLGSCLEFEAVLGERPGEDEAASADSLVRLCEAMAVAEGDRIAVAYADLLGI
ncbi:MAG: class IV adenylate cyclase [Myxococcales bacterium]|nr:class IV adenylate cyclase [Myxococcales bacterium]